MSENWVTFSWAQDERFDALRNLLESKGISASHRHMTGEARAFLTASGLHTSEPIAFRNGHVVGNLEQLKDYFSRM